MNPVLDPAFAVPALAIGGSIVIAIIAIHLAMRLVLRRRQTAEAERAVRASGRAPVRWLLGTLNEAMPPVVLLLWIQGLGLATRVVSERYAAEHRLAVLLTVLGGLCGAGTIAALCWLATRVGRRMETLLTSIARHSHEAWDDALLPLAGRLIRRALPLLTFLLGGAALAPTPELAATFRVVSTLTVIAFVAWGLLQTVDTAASLTLHRYRVDVADNLQARAVHTQIVVLKKVARTIIAIFTLASMLMVFDSARQFGASILASAGIAGIVVGLAAQKSIGTMLAGFQIALTQPIRVDDVVIVEGEWGRIEDITLTYVVVKVWDLRRLVVPITYFIEHPFQNWTRSSSAILATVFLHVDYSAPIGALREELTRILQASRYWDGAVNVLQVTDAKTHTLELRALASAADASLAWDLRCEVREKLVGFIQEHYPQSLPRMRAIVDTPAPIGADTSA